VKKHLYIFILLFAVMHVSAQTEVPEANDEEEDEQMVKPELNPDIKAGIKLGVGLSSMVGAESKTSQMLMVVSGGAYVKYILKKNWLLQPEAIITRRGSNFNNGIGSYSRIQCYFLDIPVLLMRGLNQNNTNVIFAGVQYSRLLNASLYKTDAPIPESTSPGINRNDILGIIGAQFHTPFIGYQLALKYGFINANNGLVPTVNPVSQGKNLQHISFEFNLLF
jgi:hypothetical protein